MKTKRTSKVTWKEGQRETRPLRPHPFVSGSVNATYEMTRHVVGSLWRLTSPMMTSNFTAENGYQPHPHQYLFHSYHHFDSRFFTGQLAVYIGKVRVTELTSSGQTVRIERNAFFIGDAVYMVVDFNCFEPV